MRVDGQDVPKAKTARCNRVLQCSVQVHAYCVVCLPVLSKHTTQWHHLLAVFYFLF
jgi:hypothetical protein